MKSITYWHPLIYSFLMRLSYKNHYRNRYEVLWNLLEPGSSLIDVCCGDGKLHDFIKDKNIDYLGLDFNPTFVRVAAKKGINSRMFNIYTDELPQADTILLQASLYQFIPKHHFVLDKCLKAARKQLIVCEAVKNHACSKSKIIRAIAQKLNNPGDGPKQDRFDIHTFQQALQPFRKHIVREFLAPNQIEYVVLLKK